MSDEDEALELIRANAPRARRAALASWRAALSWTWLAWRLTFRVWIYGTAEAVGLAVGFVLYGLLGCSVLCIAAARGFAGLFVDTWRWLWRRD